MNSIMLMVVMFCSASCLGQEDTEGLAYHKDEIGHRAAVCGGYAMRGSCDKPVDSTNKHELIYLSGNLLPSHEWAKCIQNLRIKEWASHNAIGKEILRNYPMYYYGLTSLAIVLFVLFVLLVHINLWVAKKNVRTSLKIVAATGLVVLFVAACSSVVLLQRLQRPPVFAKLSQECEFLERRTDRFEVPRFYCDKDYVVVADDPFDMMWKALPRLDEGYIDYVKRWHEPAGIHRTPSPGWKEGPNGWYNELEMERMRESERNFREAFENER